VYTVNGILALRLEGDMSIGTRLKQARERQRLTQRQLAVATGVGLRTIRLIEQTDADPRLSTARTLATALDVPVEWLVFGFHPPTQSENQEPST
jgi:transcriptional regulator with XRE-family HTH domain